MNKLLSIFLSLCGTSFSLTFISALLIYLLFTASASASLHDRAMLSDESIHSSSITQDTFQANNKKIAQSKAAFAAGIKYLNGTGVEKDINHAIDLFKFSAKSGYVEAQLLLGLMYQTGIDIPTDYKQAQLWFKYAAKHGNADAQLFLGLMYAKGKGVKQDYSQAIFWFHKAAQQENPEAEFNLGVMYAKSLGVPQDIDLAMLWFRKAAQHGNAQAQYNLVAIEKMIRDLSKEQLPHTTMSDALQGKL